MIKMERRHQAARFVAEVDRAARLLSGNPSLGMPRGDGVRGLVLAGVPYTMYYVLRSEQIVVAAIAHHRRRDGYWRKRLGSLEP